RRIRGLDDSKKLSHAQREDLYPRIVERALAWHVELVPVEEIDRLNILQATLGGMRRCVLAPGEHAPLARTAGNMLPRPPAIMAASILAKVSRDRLMCRLHEEFPVYGFDEHKGYATPAHLAALASHGPCVHHRRSFAPVRLAAGGQVAAEAPDPVPGDLALA